MNFRRGVTVRELGIVLVVAALLAAVLTPCLRRPRVHRCYSGMKDSTRVRGIHQGMMMWAQPPATTESIQSAVALQTDSGNLGTLHAGMALAAQRTRPDKLPR